MGDVDAEPRSEPDGLEIRAVFDAHLDVTEASPMATTLASAFSVGNNVARSVFLNPEARTTLSGWDQSAAQVVALLRSGLRDRGVDDRFSEIIGELGAHSDGFRHHWAAPAVATAGRGDVEFFHPMTGVQHYECRLEPRDGGFVMTWSPADAAAAESLRRLHDRTAQD